MATVARASGVSGWFNAWAVVIKQRVGLAFIAIAATGCAYEDFPIEIGWALPDGGAGALRIVPARSWVTNGWDRSDTGQLQHSDLAPSGSFPPSDVAQHLNLLLPSPTLALTEHFDCSSYWLGLLFEAGYQGRQFELGDFWRCVNLAARPGPAGAERRGSFRLLHVNETQRRAEQLRSVWLRSTLPH